MRTSLKAAFSLSARLDSTIAAVPCAGGGDTRQWEVAGGLLLRTAAYCCWRCWVAGREQAGYLLATQANYLLATQASLRAQRCDVRQEAEPRHTLRRRPGQGGGVVVDEARLE
eukprot:scaffold111894_cov90-Phaeocystis_antarctica.AAC.2